MAAASPLLALMLLLLPRGTGTAAVPSALRSRANRIASSLGMAKYTAAARARAAADAPGAVHVAVAADRAHFAGVVAVIRSTSANSAQPFDLRFHLLVPSGAEGELRAYLRCRGVPAVAPLVTVLGFDGARVAPLIRVESGVEHVGNLSSTLNYARFYLPELLPPYVRSVVYLDADVVVRGNVNALARRALAALKPSEVVAAVGRPKDRQVRHTYAAFENASALFEARYGYAFNASKYGFNAGVLVIDLERWARFNLTADAEWWLRQHARADPPLWRLGSQPPLHLMLYGRWHPLSFHWNLDGLGWNRNLGMGVLSTAQLLHWTGVHKPWLRHGLYRELWRPWKGGKVCAGRGRCKRSVASDAEPPCACAPGARHALCDRDRARARRALPPGVSMPGERERAAFVLGPWLPSAVRTPSANEAFAWGLALGAAGAAGACALARKLAPSLGSRRRAASVRGGRAGAAAADEAAAAGAHGEREAGSADDAADSAPLLVAHDDAAR